MNIESRPRRGEQVVWRRGEDGVVLLNPVDGTYFSLDETGARIWELCDGQLSVSEIAEALGNEYDAPFEAITADAVELLSELDREGLLGPAT